MNLQSGQPGSPTSCAGHEALPFPSWRPTLDHPLAAVAIAVALLLPLHLWLSRDVPGPSLLWDGQGYLATARWFARTPELPFLGDLGFYHAGYPLLITPVFLLLSAPEAIFRGVVVVNALAALVTFILLCRLGTSAFGLAPRRALGLAGLASLYPAVLLQSGFEWPESAFMATFAGCALLAWRLLIRVTAAAAAALGAATAFLYAVHPRGIGMVAATAGLFGIVALRERGRAAVAAGVGLGALVVGMVATSVVHASARSALWAPGTRPASAGLGDRLTDVGHWPELLLRAAGQLWYLTVASLGLTVLGTALLISLAAGRWPEGGPFRSSGRIFAGYLLAAMTAMAFAAAVQVTTHSRVDHLVYGRYNEGFLPVLLVAGGAWLLGPGGTRARLALTLATVGGAGLLTVVVVAGNGGEAFHGTMAVLNVLGVLVFDRSRPHHLDVTLISVLALAVMVVVGWLSLRRPATAGGLVALIFLASAFDLERRVTTPFARDANSTYVLAPQVDHFSEPGHAVAYDLTAYDMLAANRYQFQLGTRPFTFFDSSRGEEPPSGVVIAAPSWGDDRPGARMVFKEPYRDQALWLVEPNGQAPAWSRGWGETNPRRRIPGQGSPSG